MKKIIAIVLLFGFLNSTTEAHEFFKIPSLLVHYSEHLSTDKSTSFIEFIQIHYFGEERHVDTDGTDEPLPFQGNHSCGISVSAFYFAGSDLFNLEPSIADFDSYILLEESAQSNYHSHIWQPPKIG